MWYWIKVWKGVRLVLRLVMIKGVVFLGGSFMIEGLMEVMMGVLGLRLER